MEGWPVDLFARDDATDEEESEHDASLTEARDERRAIELGFVFDARIAKWRHPLCREYVTTRARYGVEDYPLILKQHEALTEAAAMALAA